jgi:hypothetical protein
MTDPMPWYEHVGLKDVVVAARHGCTEEHVMEVAKSLLHMAPKL